MEKQARERSNNWVITVESRNDQHEEIILATIAKRAYQLFEQRGYAHGFDLDDWITAEKELLQNDFNGNTSQFDLFIESPRDPKVTTILSMTTHSMIVFRSHARHAGEVGGGPDVASVHLFPEEIDTTKTNVNGMDGLLHVHLPKKKQPRKSELATRQQQVSASRVVKTARPDPTRSEGPQSDPRA